MSGAAGARAEASTASQPAVVRLRARFAWRVTLVQFLANAVVIGFLIVVLPGLVLHASHEVLAVLWLATVFGIVSTLVRPTLEFFFLPYVLQRLPNRLE